MVSEKKSWRPQRLEISKQIGKGKKLSSDLIVPKATIRDEWGILTITFSYHRGGGGAKVIQQRKMGRPQRTKE